MEIYIGADHRGFRMKNDLLLWFHNHGYQVTDIGGHKEDPEDNYPEYAELLAEAVAQDPENRRGILLCGSGAGMAIAANKVKGIRAALIHDARIAKSARNDDNINVLALGADFVSSDTAEQVIQAFLKTPFSGADKHVKRIGQIAKMEGK
ncbi:MAG: RpiB/LacA/LacB family sugar-phosphate isomerase [bacterium]|nr:RpiB/LacA/LacB family sugar-phosphate isomerase [bacterium]